MASSWAAARGTDVAHGGRSHIRRRRGSVVNDAAESCSAADSVVRDSFMADSVMTYGGCGVVAGRDAADGVTAGSSTAHNVSVHDSTADGVAADAARGQ